MTDTVLTKGAGSDVAELDAADLFGEVPAKPVKKKPAAKKSAGKKAAAKKAPAEKKPAAKKAPAKKSAPAKKAAVKKTPTKKSEPKTKPTAKKAAVKKVAPKTAKASASKSKPAKTGPDAKTGAGKKGKAISKTATKPAAEKAPPQPKAAPKPKAAEPSAIPLSKAAPNDQDLIADAVSQKKAEPQPKPEPVPEPLAQTQVDMPTSKLEDGSHWDGSEALAPSRALTLSDFAPPSSGPVERMIRLAYRIGIPGPTLTSPFRKPAKTRILATVTAPPLGKRTAGMALRAGHFLVHGVKAPIAEMDFGPAQGRLTPPFERVVHGFSWMRDLAASAPREQCAATAERVTQSWLDANPKPDKSDAWKVEHVGSRVLAWLMYAPMLMSRDDSAWRGRMLAAIEGNARWLDHHVPHENDRLAEISGWAGVTAAGLLLPEGKPRRLFGEAGLLKALGDLVAEDGGVLSRSPLAQMDAIALLIDLRSCYEAAAIEMPSALGVMLELLVPPLLALRHGDGGLGSWQGGAATNAEELATLIEASGVRTRPLKDIRQWGFQRLTGGNTTVQFDAAPPPRARYARFGCASTLAFEMSDGAHRLIVNCGGAAVAGGQVPARIEQGLRASAAHSTLVLDNVNSTSVLIKGKLGKGVELVEVDKRLVPQKGGEAMRVEACHDGYTSRFDLMHRRILMLGHDGEELRGEDILLPSSKRAKRGKIGFAMRFHLGLHIEARVAEDRRGASLVLPDGSLWQFRLAGDDSRAAVSLEESLWVDGAGKPHPIEQLVVQGMASRGGEQFSWLFKKMS